MKITHQILDKSATIDIRTQSMFAIGQAAIIDVHSSGESTKDAAKLMVKNLNECVTVLKEMKEAIEREFLNGT